MERNEFKIEICANGVESCLAAQEGGADRVELCAGIPEGGTTPSYGEIKVARKVLERVRLHVIIRPRGGDFLYSALELERMVEDIKVCKNLGADGVVLGCLTPYGDVDVEACKMLLTHAQGMSTTFHRAFDRTQNPMEALESIIELGFDRVLTSGLQPTAIQGSSMLKKLQEHADGRIVVMAGCGVIESNIHEIYKETGIVEYHFSARRKKPSQMKYFNPAVYMGEAGADENALNFTNVDRVKKTIAALMK